MAFRKKTWKDRLVEFAGRRILTRVSGSADSQMVVDVARNEGTVSQIGDAFSEANMNDLENRIAEGFDGAVDKDNALESIEELEANTEKGYFADALVVKEIYDSLGGLNFFEDEDGTKYVVGADSVPKKLGSGIFGDIPDGNLITTGLTFDPQIEYQSGGYFVKDGMCYVSMRYKVLAAGAGNAAYIRNWPISLAGNSSMCVLGLTDHIYGATNAFRNSNTNMSINTSLVNGEFYMFGMYHTSAADTE